MKRWIACLLLATSLYGAEPFYYLGVDGGYLTGISTASHKLNIGITALGPGVAVDPTPRAGYDVGGNVGYRFPCLLRSDVSYHYLHQSYDWHAAFPVSNGATQVGIFSAQLGTHLVLGNLYLHLSDLYSGSFCSNFDPYLQGGVGVAINWFHDILELAADADPVAEIKAKTVAQLAFRFGIGLFAYSSNLWIVDTAVQVTYIGEVRSGNTRLRVRGTPITQGLRPYKFENNWIGTFNVGIKFGGRS